MKKKTRKTDKTRQDKPIQVKMTESFKKKVIERAEILGMNYSEYIRFLVIKDLER